MRLAAALFVGTLCGCGTQPGATLLTPHELAAVYGQDDRLEVWDHPNPDLVATAQSAGAVLVWGQQVVAGANGSTLNTQPLASKHRLCTDERFAAQPSAAFCTATLIDDDLVLTAAHCVVSDAACRRTRFVFDWYYTSNGVLADIDDADVYGCRARVVAIEQAGPPSLDLAVIQLDRAPPRLPATMSSGNGALTNGAAVSSFGSTAGIPLKLDSGGLVQDPRATALDYFSVSVDAFGASSGSPVIDGNGELVGMLARGNLDWQLDGDCRRATSYDANETSAEQAMYAFRVTEALCATGWPSAALCGVAPSCGDGMCTGSEDSVGCTPDCPAPVCGNAVCEAGELIGCEDCVAGPEGWLCDPTFYGTGDGCDCQCGIADPDCADGTQDVFNCLPGEACSEGGVCEDQGLPAGWTCPPNYFGGSDGCDCGCGGYDPDCDSQVDVFGCTPGVACIPPGVCADSTGTGGTGGTGGGAPPPGGCGQVLAPWWLVGWLAAVWLRRPFRQRKRPGRRRVS